MKFEHMAPDGRETRPREAPAPDPPGPRGQGNMATRTGETAGPARARLPHMRDVAAVAASVLAAAAVLVGGIQYAVAEVDARLQAMDARFEARLQAMEARFDVRFQAMNARFEAMEERLYADIAAMREDIAENRERLIRIETIVNDIGK